MAVTKMSDVDRALAVTEREAKLLAIAEARADVAAGRIIRHEDMVRWLCSWGTPDELPPPSTWK